MTLKRGTHVLFADGKRNGGSPMAGGVPKHPTGNSLQIVDGGTYCLPIQSDLIDHWEYGALIEGLKVARRQGVSYPPGIHGQAIGCGAGRRTAMGDATRMVDEAFAGTSR